jgi:N-acetylglutamate synthase-like GNAT family acetyltransferase
MFGRRDKMELDIRVYQSSDYKACRILWVELTRYHRDIYEDQAIGGEDPGVGFDSYLKNEKLYGPWVAIINGQIVGFTGLLVDNIEAEIEPVIISKQYQHQGVGKLLVERVIKEAEELKVKFLNVRPVARNIEAISFFVKAGFNLIGHINLFQDLSKSSEREWKTGISIHEFKLKY